MNRPRDGSSRRDARLAAPADRARDPGDDPVRLDRAGQHRVRSALGAGGADPRRGPRRQRGRVPREASGRLRHPRGRGRRPAVGRTEAAPGHRPSRLQGRSDPRPRRGDLAARFGVRGAGGERLRQPDEGPHDAGHRPPALDGEARRPDRRPRGGEDRRGRDPPRALDSWGPLPQASRHAVLRRRRRAGPPREERRRFLVIRSMTGFGRARRNLAPETSAELVAKSVNHRFLDLTIKVRETEGALEPVLRRVFTRALSRGKVEVALRVRKGGEVAHEITINEGLIEAVLRRVRELSGRYPVAGTLEARDLLAIPQIFSVENGGGEYSPEEVEEVERLAEEAAAALVAMRESEGAAVAADLASRIGFLQKKVGEISSRREEITRNLFETLRARIQALFPQVTLEPGRIEQEAALAADRSDISEELQRLEAHLTQFSALVASSSEPVGKRLDFLSQEILREMNTLGSKARDLQLTREVLEMKSEIEKIREQVQNVE